MNRMKGKKKKWSVTKWDMILKKIHKEQNKFILRSDKTIE